MLAWERSAMKKYIFILCAMLLPLMLSGCKDEDVSADKPLVYTGFYALYDFASEIAGDNADIVNMVPAGTEPHDWEPGVKDMAGLNKADIVFYNGLGMEAWTDKALSSLENADTVFVRVSDGTDIYDSADPHIWLDPENVKIMCGNILSALCSADPEHSEEYEANYNSYVSELDELDNAFSSELAPYKGRSIVVSHSAFGYLCNAYGLKQEPIDGPSADSEPSPDRMLELVNFIKNNDIKYIFCEKLVSQKTADTLAEETGAGLLYLDPFEGLTQEEISRGDNYISVMYSNLESLKKALMQGE